MTSGFLPVHVTHIVIAITFAITIISVSALELYFIVLSTSIVSSTDLLYIVAQNIGIAIANSYFRTSVNLSASGLSENTQTPREANPPGP